ncbi:hypothetical protein TVAG_329590 [Trichomonas vaginalis G3]|uniref:Uncharacterized protein n=1 Tax=Trichomonas vaginalis (strain ATCC PRA-98 / G3) TaxID=412133 RepID=A2EBC7_TRIV3|nr:zinc ion binding [Trichomonas vaginalis G3]EAY10072.1 hypothetical protein TVAG_329590 [Trichomonas vaginalis G3]KAI5528478.1 zinc ion binding [Trichomonas vaginalis G3]|eukprot:XP_001322295.1 hypothetical protein [Trichomonas vaginalis G3]
MSGVSDAISSDETDSITYEEFIEPFIMLGTTDAIEYVSEMMINSKTPTDTYFKELTSLAIDDSLSDYDPFYRPSKKKKKELSDAVNSIIRGTNVYKRLYNRNMLMSIDSEIGSDRGLKISFQPEQVEPNSINAFCQEFPFYITPIEVILAAYRLKKIEKDYANTLIKQITRKHNRTSDKTLLAYLGSSNFNAITNYKKYGLYSRTNFNPNYNISTGMDSMAMNVLNHQWIATPYLSITNVYDNNISEKIKNMRDLESKLTSLYELYTLNLSALHDFTLYQKNCVYISNNFRRAIELIEPRGSLIFKIFKRYSRHCFQFYENFLISQIEYYLFSIMNLMSSSECEDIDMDVGPSSNQMLPSFEDCFWKKYQILRLPNSLDISNLTFVTTIFNIVLAEIGCLPSVAKIFLSIQQKINTWCRSFDTELILTKRESYIFVVEANLCNLIENFKNDQNSDLLKNIRFVIQGVLNILYYSDIQDTNYWIYEELIQYMEIFNDVTSESFFDLIYLTFGLYNILCEFSELPESPNSKISLRNGLIEGYYEDGNEVKCSQYFPHLILLHDLEEYKSP